MITSKHVMLALAAYFGKTIFFPSKQKSVFGRTVLVTGAGAGVGRSLALELAKMGARAVIILDVNPKTLEETKELINKSFPKVVVRDYVCNLASREEIYETANEIKRHEQVEIVINNAGVITGRPLLESDDSRNELTMKINALSHIYMTKAFLPDMIKRGFGHIAGVASMAGLIGAAGMVDYSASKFAARGFYESLALELHEQGINGIHVSCILPTLIDTGLFEGFHVPLNPTLKTLDVAQAVIWAIEHNREFLVLPGWLMGTAIIYKGLVNLTGSIGIKTPFDSPMKNWNDTKANEAFKHIQGGSKL